MKKRTYILFIQLFLIIGSSQAQIGLGTTLPDASAIMDITSTEKGILIPRMTTAERSLITNPANGLLIYNTDKLCVETNSGDASVPNWTSVSGPKGVVGLDGPIGDTGVAGADLVSTYVPTGSNNSFSGSSVVLGGYNNSAQGVVSGIAGGFNNTAIGGSSFIGGGKNNTTEAVANTIFGGSSNYTDGTNTFIGGGLKNSSKGNNSVIVGGTENTITPESIDATISGGTTNAIEGVGIDATISGGANNIVNAFNGTVSGGSLNKVLANSATVSGGLANEATGAGEWVGGLYATNTAPASATDYTLFHIGNGTGTAANLRSDAFLIKKDGTATLPSVSNTLIDAGSEKVIITKEYADANYFKFSTIPPDSATDDGHAGEIRITPTFIYTCYEKDKWVRVPSETYTSVTSNASSLIASYDCISSAGILYQGYVASEVTQIIEATVLVAGTYLLTATANGITFSASGFFPAIGKQTIVFKATGIPLAASASDTFTINTTPNCSFQRTTEEANLYTLFGDIIGNTICENKIISTRGCTAYTVTVGTTIYNTVTIAKQCWMTENLKEIPSNFSGFTPTSWTTTTPGDLGYWGYYNQVTSNGLAGWGTTEIPNEGYLYQWSAAMNGSTAERAQGVCPTDWHIPSDCEWMYLENALGMSITDQQLTGSRNSGAAGSQLSALTPAGTNSSGFSVILAGNRDYVNPFSGRGTETEFWSSTQVTAGFPVIRKIESLQTGIFRSNTTNPAYGYSVRCLKD